jgi:hypothetical protein
MSITPHDSGHFGSTGSVVGQTHSLTSPQLPSSLHDTTGVAHVWPSSQSLQISMTGQSSGHFVGSGSHSGLSGEQLPSTEQ